MRAGDGPESQVMRSPLKAMHSPTSLSGVALLGTGDVGKLFGFGGNVGEGLVFLATAKLGSSTQNPMLPPP
jgi:hypothetical protein